MEAVYTVIAGAVAQGLVWLGKKVMEKTVEDGLISPALEPVTERLRRWIGRGPGSVKEEGALRSAVQSALAGAGAPVDDEKQLGSWLRELGLERLLLRDSPVLSRQLALAVLAYTEPGADPPEALVTASGCRRDQLHRLSQFLTNLRAQLATLDAWRAPIEYANEMSKLGRLQEIAEHLSRLTGVFVMTEAGEALRVVVENKGLSGQEAAAIEERYREELVRELRLHDFRGIVQMRRDIRLPLADIYLEPGLLSMGDEEERRRTHEKLLAMRDEERLPEEERRHQQRVTDALAQKQRLVVLGEPGSGKTVSLKFISLMLAYGHGAARLGLDAPYIPVMVRLADYVRELERTPALSLDNFLIQVVQQTHASHTRLGEFIRAGLDEGACMILLDGLDEVGGDVASCGSLRSTIVGRVQQFGDRWCSEGRANRLVVTSRIEGYWDEALRGFDHVQLSPLQPPDEVREFLLRWYTAHECSHDGTLPHEEAERRAAQRVEELMPRLMEWPSVRRLASNPLLLTILALIYENVGRLPNRRIKLYEICAQTLIESWRQVQVGLPSRLLADLGEETVIRIMAPLAYWLHERQPGGTASFEDWRLCLLEILTKHEGFSQREAGDIADRFLHHARYEAGLLAERGLGQFGFFHLTFEEYLAARELARQPVDKRREMMRAHWEDPRWQEVILLAAGQLGIIEAKKDDTSDCLEDMLQIEPTVPENAGRQVVLAGRALADIGLRSVNEKTRRWVLDDLQATMQDVDPKAKRPSDPPVIHVRSRYAAGELLDELGWLPEDLHAWVRCPGCADGGADLVAMKYPVTNVQFERFMLTSGYDNPSFWGGGESEAWQWRMRGTRRYSSEGTGQPKYWNDTRFGRERRGYPVVGVSWFEAAAYAAWLTGLLRRARESGRGTIVEDIHLIEDLLRYDIKEIRLPAESEWERIAGGIADENRYPWDPAEGPVTTDEKAIVARANTWESELRGTSPAGMYPLGSSVPYGLMELAGNVREWTNSWYDEEETARVLRGGSWLDDQGDARCSARDRVDPDDSSSGVGFRLVSPASSGF